MNKSVEKNGLEDMLIGNDDVPCSDYENREIVINGYIDGSCLSEYTMPIIRMNRDDDDMNIPIEERQPIKLYLACYGGDAVAGFTLIDIIKASKTPIIAITFNAYSMAFLISIACKQRYCYKNSTFMLHDGALSIQNSSGKARDMYEFFAIKNDEIVKDFIVDHTNISKRLVNKNWRKDWYLTSEEALKLGIVDEILTEII